MDLSLLTITILRVCFSFCKTIFFFNQIKDMALKASGAYRCTKPCTKPYGHQFQNQNRSESDISPESERCQCSYRRTGSSNSTPRWGKEMEARLKGLSSGEGTPPSMSNRVGSLSQRVGSVIFMEEEEPKEWVAQVEPGVLITFVSMPQGGNDLKRIRFRYVRFSFINFLLTAVILF